MKFILLTILFLGCGKVNSNKIPKDESTLLERNILDEVLATIQEDFDREKISVKLKSIPYRVTTLKNGHIGMCYRKNSGRGVAIVLDHSIFEHELQNDKQYGRIYKVLLHEIGHCFFNRNHEDEAGQQRSALNLNLGTSDEPQMSNYLISPTVMLPADTMFDIPKKLWPYYINEIASKIRFKTIEEFKDYLDQN